MVDILIRIMLGFTSWFLTTFIFVLIIYIVLKTYIFILSILPFKDDKDNNVVDREVEKFNEEARAFNQEIEELRKDYITYIQRDEIKKKYRKLYKNLSTKMLPKEGILRDFVETYFSLDEHVKKWNEEFVENEMKENKDIFNNIDGKSLDDQQRRAVVVDEMNNLVLAGAGSGKTLTISAKVKYLVDRKSIKPDEILLISFTRKAAEEMEERISNKLNIDIQSMTFHKLGLEIITMHRESRPDVSDDLRQIINTYFRENIYNDKKQLNLFLNFFGYYLNVPKNSSEFKNLGEKYDFYKGFDFETMKSKFNNDIEVRNEIERQKQDKQTIQGEIVKSLEELMIANFLFLNGIDYIYEYKYPFEQEDKYRKHYRPDFYLPEYDIYIEHFGITENFKTPWLNEIEEQKYLDGVLWKRKEHRKNGTKLLETYSYYNKKGILLLELEKMLKREGVEFREINHREIYQRITASKENRYFKEFVKLVESFIQLFKSNGYGIDKFDELKETVNKIDNKFLIHRNNMFLDLVKPIYIEYEEYLRKTGSIDFNDMINVATDIVENGHLEFNYKYIIIDEYQDISMSRYKLTKAIRDRTNAKIMCVGDDWQSIYRFAGSDINLFTNFEKYFGYYELLKIEKTYRNSRELIDIAGNFVMKNPSQLKKNLKSDKRHSNPIRIFYYDSHIYYSLKKAIDEIIYLHGENTNITILGRNGFDIDFLEKDNKEIEMELRLIKSENDKFIEYKDYPDLKINYLTVHRSKGLEADNVIIINLENKLVGFPNKISDDPVLSLVLTDSDKFNFAEERRLFYVALTRTKNTTYLIAPYYKQSVFVEELVEEYNIRFEYLNEAGSTTENINCPKCQKGYLIVRENNKNSNKFLGCSNYPMCDYTLSYLEIIDNHIKCNSCGGFMVERNGKYGKFYGCSNYPYCNNTLMIEDDFLNINHDIPFYNTTNDNYKTFKNNIEINEYNAELGMKTGSCNPKTCNSNNCYNCLYYYLVDEDLNTNEFINEESKNGELNKANYNIEHINNSREGYLDLPNETLDIQVKIFKDEDVIAFNEMMTNEDFEEIKHCSMYFYKSNEYSKYYDKVHVSFIDKKSISITDFDELDFFQKESVDYSIEDLYIRLDDNNVVLSIIDYLQKLCFYPSVDCNIKIKYETSENDSLGSFIKEVRNEFKNCYFSISLDKLGVDELDKILFLDINNPRSLDYSIAFYDYDKESNSFDGVIIYTNEYNEVTYIHDMVRDIYYYSTDNYTLYYKEKNNTIEFKEINYIFYYGLHSYTIEVMSGFYSQYIKFCESYTTYTHDINDYLYFLDLNRIEKDKFNIVLDNENRIEILMYEERIFSRKKIPYPKIQNEMYKRGLNRL